MVSWIVVGLRQCNLHMVSRPCNAISMRMPVVSAAMVIGMVGIEKAISHIVRSREWMSAGVASYTGAACSCGSRI